MMRRIIEISHDHSLKNPKILLYNVCPCMVTIEIYIGFYSPLIIKYFEPMMGDMFKACFAYCHSDETIFPLFGKKKYRFLKNGVKLHGTHHRCLILTHTQIKVNLKFKRLFIYKKKLQTSYPMHLLTQRK